MGFYSYFSAEREDAEHILATGAKSITGGLASFSAWLMAGSGAAFALLLINLDKLAPRLSEAGFKWALMLFAVSLLAGLISRWMATSVASQLAVLESIQERAVRIHHPRFSARALFWFCATNSRWWVRRSMWRAYRDHCRGARSLMSRGAAQKSQLQSVFATAQMFFVVCSVVALTLAIRL